jgi:hypothetical protein
MNKETLRMQMLAGVITESQYKQRLNEGRNMDELINLVKNNFQTIKDNFIKNELEIIDDVEYDDDSEKEEDIEFLNDQMNVSTAEDLINAINERSLGVDLSVEDEVRDLYDEILNYM